MYKTKGIPNSRIEIADALRGIAVMGIIIFHCLENFNIFLDDKSMALPTDATVFYLDGSFLKMNFGLNVLKLQKQTLTAHSGSLE